MKSALLAIYETGQDRIYRARVYEPNLKMRQLGTFVHEQMLEYTIIHPKNRCTSPLSPIQQNWILFWRGRKLLPVLAWQRLLTTSNALGMNEQITSNIYYIHLLGRFINWVSKWQVSLFFVALQRGFLLDNATFLARTALTTNPRSA